jgi:hypothetical protein
MLGDDERVLLFGRAELFAVVSAAELEENVVPTSLELDDADTTRHIDEVLLSDGGFGYLC